MELWNDFEGKTVADRYPLEQLLGPQGRSAFFRTTANGSGPAVIRLIETHFDEDEILDRWRRVQALDQPNLQQMRDSGEATLDGTKLVYAVLEAADMNLADALRERRLTTAETRQVALSVIPALRSLHAAGLVHEHVEAGNVLAQGEVVKLRSDCVREAPEGAEGEAARAADVRGLALLLLQSLTQTTDGSRAAQLPAPFAEMVRHGMDGSWGLQEMGSAAGVPPAGVAATAVQTATPQADAVMARPDSPAGSPFEASAAALGSAARVPVRAAQTRPTEVGTAAAPGRLRLDPLPASDADAAAPANSRILLEPVAEDEPRRWGVWAAAFGVAIALFLLWHFLHHAATPPPAQETAPLSNPGAPAPAAPRSGTTASVAPATAAPVETSAAAAAHVVGGHGNWRVVAYTYNHEDQARHKAAQIAARHSGLQPQAWSPTGRGPWLVALGGWKTEREARDVQIRARRQGLPRDTFIRSYRR